MSDHHFVRVYGEAGPVVNCTCGGYAKQYPGGTGLSTLMEEAEAHIEEARPPVTPPGSGTWTRLYRDVRPTEEDR